MVMKLKKKLKFVIIVSRSNLEKIFSKVIFNIYTNEDVAYYYLEIRKDESDKTLKEQPIL